MLADLARRDGRRVLAFDLFGDLDLRASASRVVTGGGLSALVDAAPDTLIARKRGAEAAAQVSAGARGVLAAGGVRTPGGRRALRSFDASLREPGNALNPGTTADVVTATLFVALLEGIL